MQQSLQVAKTIQLLKLLTLSALLAFGVAANAQSNSAVEPVPRDTDFWQNRFAEISKRIEQGNVDLLFVGDSITHFWEGTSVARDGTTRPATGQAIWDRYYGNRNAASIGIAGDQTQHVLWRLDHGHVDGISPKLAVLMIGTNNSRANTATEIGKGIVAVVEKLNAKLPTTPILLLAIFPRGTEPSEVRSKLAEASGYAAGQLADNDMVEYLNIGAEFLDEEGGLSAEIMPDALHPSAAGYQIWAETIEPVVARYLGR